MTVAESPARTKLEVGFIVRQSFTVSLRAAYLLVPLAILNEAIGRGIAWLVTRTDPFVIMAGTGQKTLNPLSSLLMLPQQFARGLVYAAMTWVAYTVYRGVRATPANLFAAWSRALVPLCIVQLVFCVAGATVAPLNWGIQPGNPPLLLMLTGIGLLVWVIAYSLVALMLYLAPDVAIVEGVNALHAIRRSAALTKGNRWRIIGIGLIVAIAVIVPMFVLWGVSGVGVPPRAPLLLWSPVGAVSLLLQMAVGVLLSSSSAVIYAESCGAIDPAPQAETFS